MHAPQVTTCDDPRVRVIELDESRGAPAARNAGVQNATAAWTAFLDDDDEWLPEKLTTQLALAEQAPYPLPVVASRLYMRTPRRTASAFATATGRRP